MVLWTLGIFIFHKMHWLFSPKFIIHVSFMRDTLIAQYKDIPFHRLVPTSEDLHNHPEYLHPLTLCPYHIHNVKNVPHLNFMPFASCNDNDHELWGGLAGLKSSSAIYKLSALENNFHDFLFVIIHSKIGIEIIVSI